MLKRYTAFLLSAFLFVSTCNADIMGITLGETTLEELNAYKDPLDKYYRCVDCKEGTNYFNCNYSNNLYSTKYMKDFLIVEKGYYPIIEVENSTHQVVRMLLAFKQQDTNKDNCGNKASNFTINDFLTANIFNIPRQNFKKTSIDKCLFMYTAVDELSNYIEVRTNSNNQLISIYYSLPEKVMQERKNNSQINALKELGNP